MSNQVNFQNPINFQNRIYFWDSQEVSIIDILNLMPKIPKLNNRINSIFSGHINATFNIYSFPREFVINNKKYHRMFLGKPNNYALNDTSLICNILPPMYVFYSEDLHIDFNMSSINDELYLFFLTKEFENYLQPLDNLL